MKTFKIDSSKAILLRRYLAWSSAGWILMSLLFGMALGAGMASGEFNAPLLVLFGAAFVGALIWLNVACWRALWGLWEWPGILLGLGAICGSVVVSALAGWLLSFIAQSAFLTYVYVQLGKQTGDRQPPKREEFVE